MDRIEHFHDAVQGIDEALTESQLAEMVTKYVLRCIFLRSRAHIAKVHQQGRRRASSTSTRAAKRTTANSARGGIETEDADRGEGIQDWILDAGYERSRRSVGIETLERRMVRSQSDEIHSTHSKWSEADVKFPAKGHVMITEILNASLHGLDWNDRERLAQWV